MGLFTIRQKQAGILLLLRVFFWWPLLLAIYSFVTVVLGLPLLIVALVAYLRGRAAEAKFDPQGTLTWIGQMWAVGW